MGMKSWTRPVKREDKALGLQTVEWKWWVTTWVVFTAVENGKL